MFPSSSRVFGVRQDSDDPDNSSHVVNPRDQTIPVVANVENRAKSHRIGSSELISDLSKVSPRGSLADRQPGSQGFRRGAIASKPIQAFPSHHRQREQCPSRLMFS
jgi:hypothetical protein